MSEYQQVIELVSAVLDRLTSRDGLGFAFDRLSQLAVGLLGVFVGYWLASKRDEKKQRLEIAIESLHQVDTMEMSLIPELVWLRGIAQRPANQTPIQFGSDYNQYIQRQQNSIKFEDTIMLLHLRIFHYLPDHIQAATKMRRAWMALGFVLDYNSAPGSTNWLKAQPRVVPLINEFLGCLEGLRNDLVKAFYPSDEKSRKRPVRRKRDNH